MGQEKNVEELSFNKNVKHVTSSLSATYALTKLQRTTVVDATSSDGDITIDLPPPDQCFGLLFWIELTTKATSDVLIHDRAHQTHLIATLDTTGDDVLLYCNGFEFIPIAGTYT